MTAAPQLAAALEELIAPELEDELDWFDAEIRGEVRGPEEIRDGEINGCRLSNLTLTGRVLHRLRVTDCVLTGCDLSGTTFLECSLIRVRLESCRLTGAVLSGVRAQDVTVEASRADQMVARMSSWKRASFINTDLRDLDGYAGDFADALFDRCELARADFSAAKLAGARLHGSTLDGIRGGDAFRGVRISGAQLLPLAESLLQSLDIEVEG